MSSKVVHNERSMHVPSGSWPWASALKFHKALPSGHSLVRNKPNTPPPPSLGSYLYVKGQLDWCIYTVHTKLPILSISLNSPQKNIIKKLKNPPPLKTYSNKTMIHPRISFLFFNWTIMSWCIITRTSISLCCKGVSQSGGYGDIVGSSWGGYTHLENIGFDIAFFGS